MDSRCLRDLDHLGNRNSRHSTVALGKSIHGFCGDLNPVDTENPSSNLYNSYKKQALMGQGLALIIMPRAEPRAYGSLFVCVCVFAMRISVTACN